MLPVSLPDTAPAPRATPKGIASNTGYSLLVQATSSIFSVVLALFLVRALTPAQYGILGLSMSIGALLLLPADFGIGWAAAKYVAEHRANAPVVARVTADAFRLKVAIAGTLCVAVAVAAPTIAAAWGKPQLASPLRFAAAVVAFQTVMTLFCSVANALRRVDLILWPYMTESVVEVVAAVALVLAGFGATGAMAARAAAFLAAAIVAAVVVNRAIGAMPDRTGAAPTRRALLRFGGTLALVDSAYALFSQIDVFIIGVILSATSVAVYAAPLRLTAFLILPAGAITAGVAPRFGRNEDWAAERPSLQRAARQVLIVQGFLIAPLVVWASPITAVVFGRHYAHSASVLRALIPFVFLSGFGQLYSLTANYLGQARLRVFIALLTVLVNVIVDLVLIPRVGVVGGAIGTDLAYLLYAPAHWWICRKIVGAIGPPRSAVLAVGGAVAAEALLLFALGLHASSAPRIALGAVGGTAIYVAVVVLTGAVSLEERARIGRRFARSPLPRSR